ncbi:MAG TPA: tyrosine-type recombinase/integrase, partial [Firmicutes bacterium]|nr:tyrosine-type recombinase/integrase [Bacillota bacterium]
RYAREAGIKKKVTPHVLRHTYATLLYRSGVVDIMTLSRLLGHSGLRNTTVYIHSDIEHLRTALEKLPSFEIIQRRLSNF